VRDPPRQALVVPRRAILSQTIDATGWFETAEMKVN